MFATVHIACYIIALLGVSKGVPIVAMPLSKPKLVFIDFFFPFFSFYNLNWFVHLVQKTKQKQTRNKTKKQTMYQQYDSRASIEG